MPPGAQPSLSTPLSSLKGIGPRRVSDLQRVGLHTVGDLLTRFPVRYEDRGRIQPIAALQEGRQASIRGEVVRCGLRHTRRPGYSLYELVIRDESGLITALWFNQRFLRDVFRVHDVLVLFGKVERRGGTALQILNPQYEILTRAGQVGSLGEEVPGDAESAGTVHTGRIVPVYERVGTLTPKMQRTLVANLLSSLPCELDEPLPAAVVERRGLVSRREAVEHAHFPPPDADVAALNAFRHPAQVRLVFEEFFAFQVGVLLEKRQVARERKPHVVRVDARVREAARAVLPFKLTAGQRGAVREIIEDLQRPHPMNRLLQGDVGAGKTIVALLASVVAMENGLQVAFMAPTEILAEQHYRTLRRFLPARYPVALLTGSIPPGERRRVESELARGALPLVIGTHALVQEGVEFHTLGLAVIDEQHRFGVVQRATLREKGLCPDVLVMTATPIPRTLSMTVFGDLDVSVVRDRPPGRSPVQTVAKPESRREDVYRFLREQMDAGQQAFVVYPLVEESEKVDVRAAAQMAEHLATEIFPAYRLGLLHGRLKADAKDRVMQAFARGDLQLLVSTTVVEVGVDVPNATVMVVEHAERFGLSQLHQLRGRVGRGTRPGSCILLYQAPLSDDARERLKVLTDTTDGFAIAEKDLELRGPGDFFGTRQSGRATLRVGDLRRDFPIMEEAREAASAWLASARDGDAEVERFRAAWDGRFGLARVG